MSKIIGHPHHCQINVSELKPIAKQVLPPHSSDCVYCRNHHDQFHDLTSSALSEEDNRVTELGAEHTKILFTKSLWLEVI